MASINDGAWHHVAVTHDGASKEVILYVDGAQDATGSLVFNATYSAFDSIGCGYRSGEIFDGLVDELAVYGSALRGTDIAALYNAGAKGKCP